MKNRNEEIEKLFLFALHCGYADGASRDAYIELREELIPDYTARYPGVFRRIGSYLYFLRWVSMVRKSDVVLYHDNSN